MLSTVQIFAAGSTGEENLDLFIDGNYETTFESVGGDVRSRDFVSFEFETSETLSASQISVAFGNDAFDPATGKDRNLLVDKIVLDGVVFETENPTTFSTGIFRDGGLTGPGFFETEFLNVNSIFTYSDAQLTTGSRIEFDALGMTGEEVIQLVLDDQRVANFNFESASQVETFSFVSTDEVAIEDLTIRFVNDSFDPTTGIDRNVQIFEYRVISRSDGSTQVSRTTDDDVISTGIFVAGEGITSRFGAGGFLATDGFVRTIRDGSTGLSLEEDQSFGNGGIVDLQSEDSAVGPNGEVLVVRSDSVLSLVDSSGQNVSTFGDNGQLDLEQLIGDRIGLTDSGSFEVRDLEFFDDGTILITGVVADEPIVGNVPSTPVVVRLTQDGVLDDAYAQQGILVGTFNQFFGPNSALEATIDDAGRVLLLGTNQIGSSSDPQNFVVVRLTNNGSLDSSFGNNGNVYLAASNFGESNDALPLGLEVNSAGEIVVGVARSLSIFEAGTSQIFLTQLNDSGEIDGSFGDGGIVDITADLSSPTEFQIDSKDRIIVAASPNNLPTLFRFTVDGQRDGSFGNNGEQLVDPDRDSLRSQGFTDQFVIRVEGLAIDRNDNVIISSDVFGGNGTTLSAFQRVLASGEIDQTFGIAGADVVPGSVNEIEFGPNNELITSGARISKYFIV